ncbi:VanZ family protein [Lederbergia citrea]|uniref:VanZ family protein n=1 Tax=Lederbergia citrea TaxID=2833581 RepID=UPI003D2906BA
MEGEMNKESRVILSISFVSVLTVLLFFGISGSYIETDLSLTEYIKWYTNSAPFKTITTYITAIFDGSMNMDIPIKNLIGNALMFLPMGIYLPYFIRKVNKVIVFSFTMVILLLIIEVAQLVTRTGWFDVDDIILRMLGALIGFLIWKMNSIQKLMNGTSVQDEGL